MSGNPPTAKKPPTARGSKSVATSDVPPPSSPQASVISASSRLVCSPHFSTWAAGVKLNPDIVQTIPDEESFRDLLAIVHSSKTYPNWLYQKDSSQLSYLVRRYGRWVNRLCERLERITPSNSDQEVSAHSGNQAADAMDEDHPRDGVPQTSSSDTGNLKDIVHVSGSLADSAINNSPLMALDDLDLDLTIAMPAILSLVDHSNSLADRFTWEANEVEQRSGIDHLLSDAYRDSSSITFRLERELKLPELKAPAFNVRATKPDAVVFLEFTQLWSYRVANGLLRSYYSCLNQKSPPRCLNVVHSLVEYKKLASGQNQALMGVVSGLYQRRVLGITDQFVFATMQTGPSNLEVVAAIWKSDMIMVYSIGNYTTLEPDQVVQFYLLHRAISALGSRYHERISQKGSEDEGFPKNRSHELASWASTAPSSTAPKTDVLGQVAEDEERETREGGPSGNQGLGDSLKELGQLDDLEKMRRYFVHFGVQV